MLQEVSLELPSGIPCKGEVYKHFKGNLYEVISVALHANDDTWMVVYKPLYDNAPAECFVRPLDNWKEKVQRDGEMLERFSLVK